MEKKSERLEVRLGFKGKQNFTDACDIQGDTPSQAIRRFINGYIRRSDRDLFASAWRGAVTRKLPKLVLGAGLTCISCIFIWMLYQNVTIVSDAEIFAVRDHNNDGQLNGDELGPPKVSAGLIRIMDINESGGVEIDEFFTKGRMVYILSGPKGNELTQYHTRENEQIALIKFKLGKFRTESGTHKNNEAHLKDIDRIIYRHKGGGITVVNGPAEIKINDKIEQIIGK